MTTLSSLDQSSARHRNDAIVEDEEQDLADIQAELERMNGSSEEINKLEKELQEARSQFRCTLTDSAFKLNQIHKKQKKSVERARPYFTTVAQSKKLQREARDAAVQFTRSISFYEAAKETIAMAEERIHNKEVEFDNAWQEMLNHATAKMLEAEKDKMRSELVHLHKSTAFQTTEQKAVKLAGSHKRSISNARPYFELKAYLELQLEAQKLNVEDLQRGVSEAKLRYKQALNSLEKISEDIHKRRLTLPIREPGVGCDNPSYDNLSLLETDLEKHMGLRVRVSSEVSGSSELDADSLLSYSSSGSSHSTASYQSSTARLSDFVDSAICSPKLDNGSLAECVDDLTIEDNINIFDEPTTPCDSQSDCTILEEGTNLVSDARSRENTLIVEPSENEGQQKLET